MDIISNNVDVISSDAGVFLWTVGMYWTPYGIMRHSSEKDTPGSRFLIQVSDKTKFEEKNKM